MLKGYNCFWLRWVERAFCAFLSCSIWSCDFKENTQYNLVEINEIPKLDSIAILGIGLDRQTIFSCDYVLIGDTILWYRKRFNDTLLLCYSINEKIIVDSVSVAFDPSISVSCLTDVNLRPALLVNNNEELSKTNLSIWFFVDSVGRVLVNYNWRGLPAFSGGIFHGNNFEFFDYENFNKYILSENNQAIVTTILEDRVNANDTIMLSSKKESRNIVIQINNQHKLVHTDLVSLARKRYRVRNNEVYWITNGWLVRCKLDVQFHNNQPLMHLK